MMEHLDHSYDEHPDDVLSPATSASQREEDEKPLVSDEWEMPAESALCSELRHRVRDILDVHYSATTVDDIELIASELFANSCRHSLSGDGGKVGIILRGWSEWVYLAVDDQGPKGGARVLWEPEVIDPLAPDGRGLLLVHMLTDGWGQHYHDGTHRVFAWFRIGWEHPERLPNLKELPIRPGMLSDFIPDDPSDPIFNHYY
ncbi:hypothetical protein JCM3263A_30650 [Thermobifida fusca]|jgi:anti-sigma regulatory factor (Ser/Thr protein kinase)|uniref:Histidine kinase/HSP90-like ATPase domain-containing protein n=2 Tax=Thermobifida fusca TaxID=2021 RepID=A0A9P2WRI6_THEFU|nr:MULTISPECIES: ATP-binding protein [Thermobifida]AAZ55017.1 hypothetical protein Tfu_0979 [Thermobifida fusca YX]EOR71866.1 hypothetical protein TM51_05307 [Thermobifida fusca TM51]MBO2528283.1 ATP-binding protein [Thermobifida sp.]MDD6792799.1 ATP-binding protein [Thermobifida fusca]PPS96141.1 hypothetical protein BH05_01850 [Thermobifida fusca]